MPVPDFILRLREQVGHDLLWRPGATAGVLRDGQAHTDSEPPPGTAVLLVKRTDNGRWGRVTDIVEPGGIRPTAPCETSSRRRRGRRWSRRWCGAGVTAPVSCPNGDRAQYLDHTFRCRDRGGAARVGDDESTEVAWFPVDDLPHLPPRLEERIRKALQIPQPAPLNP